MIKIIAKIVFFMSLLNIHPAMAASYVYPAVCQKSYSKQGEQSEDLTKQSGRPIKCDSVILSLPENGHVLVQLAQKGAGNLTPLGFGGDSMDYETNPSFVTVPLQRVYLPHSKNANTPQVVDGIEGFCFLGGKLNIRSLEEISCTAMIEIGTQKLIYNVKMRITGPGQLVPER
jgi:hypothetical protein